MVTRAKGFGHCRSNQYLHVTGKHPTGPCECGYPETIKHVLVKCKKYNTERQIYYTTFILYKRMSDLGVKSLFGHDENPQLIIKAVLKFLHNTKLQYI